jgi:phospholipase C
MSNWKISRRDALKNLAIAAGAASVPSWLTACAAPEDAVDPQDASIDHVIVVMMENRSFDHYFGSLTLAGRSDVDGLTKDMFNLDSNGDKVFVHKAERRRVCVEDPPHGWSAYDLQFGGGKNDGFIRAHLENGHHAEAIHDDPTLFDIYKKTVMQYYTPDQLPFLHNLANDFALCQKWFCSVRGPTWPNRWYLHGAQSNGETGNNFNGKYEFEMIYDRLTAKDISWGYYYSDLPFLALAPALKERHKDKDFLRGIKRFFQDIDNEQLPQYCMVDPGFALNDDHPPHHVGLGQQFLSSIYHAVAQSKYWDKCLFVITYDENGGFFDHVAPPTTKDNFADKGFDRLGFRVPSVVAGPYVKQTVSDTVYDHTSVLAFLEWRFGLEPLTQRDANANNLTDVLDFTAMKNRKPRKAPIYDPVVVPASEVGDECYYGSILTPPADHDMHIAANLGLIPAEYDLRPERGNLIKLIAKIEESRVR